jgi:hypothetical protein
MAKKKDVIATCVEVGFGKVPGATHKNPAWQYGISPGLSHYRAEPTLAWDVSVVTKEIAESLEYAWRLVWISGETMAVFSDDSGAEWAQPVPKSSVDHHKKEAGKECKGCGSIASVHMSDCPIKYPKGPPQVPDCVKEEASHPPMPKARKPLSMKGESAQKATGATAPLPPPKAPRLRAVPPAPEVEKVTVASTPPVIAPASKLAKFLAKHNL